MKEGSRSVMPRFMEVLIVLYVFHTTLPIFGYFIPAAVHGAAVLLLFALLAVYDRSFVRNLGKVLPVFAIYFLSIVYHGFSNFAMEMYGLLQLVLYPMLALYLMQHAGEKALKRMLIFIGLSYVATAITTYIGNQMFPLASRQLAAIFQSDEVYMYDVYMKMNIGGFNFIYALVLLTPAVIFLIRSKNIPFLVGILLLVLFGATVIISEYTTALLSFLLILLSLLFLRKDFGGKQIGLLMTVAFIVVIVFDQLLFPQLTQLTGLFGSEAIDARLTEMSDFSTSGGASEGDLGSRINLYGISLNSFIQSPLWGSPNAKFGGHSYVFDNLARYGLLGLLGMIWMYRQMYRLYYKPLKNADFYGYALFTFAMAILLALLNPKDNLSVLTFMIPVIGSYFSKKTQQR